MSLVYLHLSVKYKLYWRGEQCVKWSIISVGFTPFGYAEVYNVTFWNNHILWKTLLPDILFLQVVFPKTTSSRPHSVKERLWFHFPLLEGYNQSQILEAISSSLWHKMSAKLRQGNKTWGRSLLETVLWTCFISELVRTKWGVCWLSLATQDKGQMLDGHLLSW